MSSKKGKLRLKNADKRIIELREALGDGIGIKKYTPYHYRIFGDVIMDYWPTKNKCWLTGSKIKAMSASPIDIAKLARNVLCL
jgi:hypothetical protein